MNHHSIVNKWNEISDNLSHISTEFLKNIYKYHLLNLIYYPSSLLIFLIHNKIAFLSLQEIHNTFTDIGKGI